jgi:tetratricopeptide (TPR) repeat protein
MPFVAVSSEAGREFWTAVEALLDAGRWTDAAVTVRAMAHQSGQFTPCVTLGTLFYERGRRNDAVREWTDALTDAQSAGQWSVAAAAHHNLAAMYRDVGDYQLARLFQQRAMSLQADCGPDELLQLGNDAIAARRWELAESLYQAAAELVEDGDPMLSDLAATRGVLCGFQGEPFVGLRWLQQAYREHVADGRHDHAGKDLLNAAALFEQLQRLGWARMCVTLARTHFELTDDAPWVRTSIQHLDRIDALQRVASIVPEWN